MELVAKRRLYGSKTTISDLFAVNVEQLPGGVAAVKTEFMCYLLEDQVRPDDEEKVPGKTAIPAGRYEIVITYSERFKRLMPLLIGVPNFTGIRIHWGNTHRDTDGCPLTGTYAGVGSVRDSRSAFKRLWKRLRDAERKEKTYIEIVDTHWDQVVIEEA